MTSQTSTTAPRNIRQTKVVGAGGRPRTVWKCEMGCWHGSFGQATKCKNGIALAVAAMEEAG